MLGVVTIVGALLASPTTGQNDVGQDTKTIELTARRFSFEPSRIEVNEGDQVTLVVRSADTTHGLRIRELNIKREIPRGGDPVTIAFTAGPPGSYDITCSEYCGRGHDDMQATLVINPRTRKGRPAPARPSAGPWTAVLVGDDSIRE
jgi:cytochrome c oxidase subunit 2